MVKPFLLPEMGASCEEEPPISISGATVLEEEATSFRGHFNGEFFREVKKKKKKLGFFKKNLSS